MNIKLLVCFLGFSLAASASDSTNLSTPTDQKSDFPISPPDQKKKHAQAKREGRCPLNNTTPPSFNLGNTSEDEELG